MSVNNEINLLVDDFNSLAEKNSLKSRLKYDGENLLLGTDVQFSINKYQCVLSNNDVNNIKLTVSSFIKQICFEYGE